MHRAYYNLHRHCWSLQHKRRNEQGKLGWKVIDHASELIVRNPEFKVSEAGRQRVLREQRKNVHAYVEGMVALTSHDRTRSPFEECSDWEQVRYNPYETSEFVYVSDGTPVVSEYHVIAVLDEDRRVWVNQRQF